MAAGASADRVARLLLRATGGPDGPAEPMDEWMLDWLADAADTLVSQAPVVAAELLERGVASSPADSVRHSWLASRLADALYRIGDTAQAGQVVIRALEHAAEPNLLVDLHWTLAQSRMLAGESAESLATLDRALACTRDLGPASRPAARAGRADTRKPRRGRDGQPGRRRSARGGGGGGRQLGHGLGAARADTGDHDAGAPDRRAAAVRPGPGGDRIRPGPDRPAAAPADQPGHHAGLPRPAPGGPRRGRASPAPREQSVPRSGWLRRTAR